MKICSEFGALGLLLYSSLRNLTFFDLEKKMLDSATARASSMASDVQPQPLDFIRPVMLFYLNTIMEFCVSDPEEVLGNKEADPLDSGYLFNQIYCDYSPSSVVTPSKEDKTLKDDSMIVGLLMGTASTAASDSVFTPTLNISHKNSSDEFLKEETEIRSSSPSRKGLK